MFGSVCYKQENQNPNRTSFSYFHKLLALQLPLHSFFTVCSHKFYSSCIVLYSMYSTLFFTLLQSASPFDISELPFVAFTFNSRNHCNYPSQSLPEQLFLHLMQICLHTWCTQSMFAQDFEDRKYYVKAQHTLVIQSDSV